MCPVLMPTGICTLELPVLVCHSLIPLAVRGGFICFKF